MRRTIGLCLLSLLAGAWFNACARTTNGQTATKKNKAARATVVLVPNKDGTCQPVTIPHHLDVSKGIDYGEMIWDLANTLCKDKSITITAIEFKSGVVEDVGNDTKHKKLKGAEENTPYKYTVTLSNKESEDPEIEVWP